MGLLTPWRRDPPTIPILRLEGMIANRGRAGRGLSLAALEGPLEQAFALKHAPCVALAINSPGGAPVQSSLILSRIRELAERRKRPVLAFIEDVGASGGYMLACAGDEIFCDASSLVGSIGVVGGGFGLVELAAKLGVERRVYTAGLRKNRLDPFAPERAEDVARYDEMLREIHAAFIALVQARRGARLGAHPLLFEGEVFTGAEAVRLGLVDGLGELRATLRARYGEAVRLKTFAPKRAPLLQRLAGADAEAMLCAGLEVLEERLARARLGLSP